jgi:RES domain
VPLTKPPARYNGTPNLRQLRRGTCLWRVHKEAHGSRSFNPKPVDSLFGGARFDATADDLYPYYYAALEERTAIAETLLRDLEPDDEGMRALSRAAVTGRQLSAVVLTKDLEMVSLVTGQDLGTIGQDAWLVTAPAHQYPQTRAWAHWLRTQAGQAHGFIWSSLRDPGSMAVVLFGDRCAADFGADYEQTLLHEVPELAIALDDKDGAAWLNQLLDPYRVAISPP